MQANLSVGEENVWKTNFDSFSALRARGEKSRAKTAGSAEWQSEGGNRGSVGSAERIREVGGKSGAGRVEFYFKLFVDKC